MCKQDGPTVPQVTHLRQRVQVCHQVATPATPCYLRSMNTKELGHRLHPFLYGVGSEAVLPSDVAFGAPRIKYYEEGRVEKIQQIDIDSLE